MSVLPSVHLVHHAREADEAELLVQRFGDVFRAMPAPALEVDALPQGAGEPCSKSSITLVLIGPETWRSKHVDWRIAATVRPGTSPAPGGLLGILLPSYRMPFGMSWSMSERIESTSPARRRYSAHNQPPRLWDHAQRGYAEIHPYPENSVELGDWLRDAAMRSELLECPRDLRALMMRDRRASMPYWRA